MLRHLEQFVFLSLVGFLLSTATVVEALEPSTNHSSAISDFTLDNGLRVLVQEDHRSPVAVVELWYRVGSSYEVSGKTGVSHVLEHMLFMGTEKFPGDSYDQLLAEVGATRNAFTSLDFTAYYAILAVENLDLLFELEADRMTGIVFDQATFEKELEVVKEERRMRTDDSPAGTLAEKFGAIAYLNSGYHNPVIGWMDDIANMTIPDLQQWYERFYTPENAILVVVGAVKPDEIKALAEKHFGKIPRQTHPPVKIRYEVAQNGERQVRIQHQAKLPQLRMGYKAAGVLSTQGTQAEWEPYALEVLASVLSGDSSSRFSKNLVRDQAVAAGVGAWYSGFGRLDKMFEVSGTPAEGKTVEALKKAIEVELKKVGEELVAAEELARVKAQVIAEEVYGRDDIQQQAFVLGSLASVGLSPQLSSEYVAKIEAVTAEQVREVAQKYLINTKRTIGILDPISLDHQAGDQ